MTAETEIALAAPLHLAEATAAARRAVAEFTGLEIDSISSCGRLGDGWRIVVDAVEAPARLGDNDLIATYEVELDAAGEVAAFSRTGRYNRSEATR